MDLNEIITVISSVGFPIVACIGIFYLYDRTIKELTITLATIGTTLDGIASAIKEMKEEKGN